jgi:predicted O-methyltransferase YrrM
VEQARANLARAGLDDVAEILHADGLDVLTTARDASVSAIVLDAERPAYPTYWPHILRILTLGGFVAVDNALSHADQLAAFRALVDSVPGIRSDLIDVGDGVLVLSREGTGAAGQE